MRMIQIMENTWKFTENNNHAFHAFENNNDEIKEKDQMNKII